MHEQLFFNCTSPQLNFKNSPISKPSHNGELRGLAISFAGGRKATFYFQQSACHIASMRSLKPLSLPSLKLTFSHLKIGFPKRKFIFQPPFFRCYVSFREGNRRSSKKSRPQFQAANYNLQSPLDTVLVGGWTNPSEKYARQIGSSPQVWGENKQYLKPPPSDSFVVWFKVKKSWGNCCYPWDGTLDNQPHIHLI